MGLAIQELRNEGRALDASKIEVTLKYVWTDIVEALANEIPSGRIDKQFVVDKADAVIVERIAFIMDEVRKAHARRKAKDDAPLAVIGQGSSRREIRPESADATGGIVGRVRRLFARMFGTEAAR